MVSSSATLEDTLLVHSFQKASKDSEDLIKKPREVSADTAEELSPEEMSVLLRRQQRDVSMAARGVSISMSTKATKAKKRRWVPSLSKLLKMVDKDRKERKEEADQEHLHAEDEEAEQTTEDQDEALHEGEEADGIESNLGEEIGRSSGLARASHSSTERSRGSASYTVPRNTETNLASEEEASAGEQGIARDERALRFAESTEADEDSAGSDVDDPGDITPVSGSFVEVVDAGQQSDVLDWDELPGRLMDWLKLNLLQRELAEVYCTDWEVTPLEEFPSLSHKPQKREQMIRDFELFMSEVLCRMPPTKHDLRRTLRRLYKRNRSESPSRHLPRLEQEFLPKESLGTTWMSHDMDSTNTSTTLLATGFSYTDMARTWSANAVPLRRQLMPPSTASVSMEDGIEKASTHHGGWNTKPPEIEQALVIRGRKRLSEVLRVHLPVNPFAGNTQDIYCSEAASYAGLELPAWLERKSPPGSKSPAGGQLRLGHSRDSSKERDPSLERDQRYEQFEGGSPREQGAVMLADFLPKLSQSMDPRLHKVGIEGLQLAAESGPFQADFSSNPRSTATGFARPTRPTAPGPKRRVERKEENARGSYLGCLAWSYARSPLVAQLEAAAGANATEQRMAMEEQKAEDAKKWTKYIKTAVARGFDLDGTPVLPAIRRELQEDSLSSPKANPSPSSGRHRGLTPRAPEAPLPQIMSPRKSPRPGRSHH